MSHLLQPVALVVGAAGVVATIVFFVRVLRSLESLQPDRHLPRRERRRLLKLALSGKQVPAEDASEVRRMIESHPRLLPHIKLLLVATGLFITSDVLEAAAKERLGSLAFLLLDVVVPVIVLLGVLAFYRWIRSRYDRTAHVNDWTLDQSF